jgi:hypothetical protein
MELALWRANYKQDAPPALEGIARSWYRVLLLFLECARDIP